MGPLLVMSQNDMAVRVGPSESQSYGLRTDGIRHFVDASLIAVAHVGQGRRRLAVHVSLQCHCRRQLSGWSARRHQIRISELVHADGLSQTRGKGTLQLRGMFSLEPFTFRAGRLAACCSKLARLTKDSRSSIGSTRTISGWSCRRSTRWRWASAEPGSRILVIRASRRWDRRRSCTVSLRQKIRRQHSRITCRIRRTSALAS